MTSMINDLTPLDPKTPCYHIYRFNNRLFTFAKFEVDRLQFSKPFKFF